jgi:serine/threonine-protein kinase
MFMPNRSSSRDHGGSQFQVADSARRPEIAESLPGVSTGVNYPKFSKYRLIARLGSGGMAEVYLAVAGGPRGFSKLQVLKILKPDLSDKERADFMAMFQDEGRLAARLNHPNIVQSHEVGSHEAYDFIAMEYLEGQPLSRIQERAWATGEQLPLEMQLYVFMQMLEGLEYAHRLTDYDGTPLNIVHRDVSPQNVFVTYSGHTKLVDFGIAKTLDSSKTRAGVVKGKVPYMSPEQVVAGHIDQRADLFSVGVMLWEAIARQPMHGTSTVYEILRRLVHGDLPKIRDVVPDISPELERVVNRALALKPEDRYPDAAAFRHDLNELMHGAKLGPREIGERVSSIFVDERRQINEVIRSAMMEMKDRESEPDSIVAAQLLPTLRVRAGLETSDVMTTGNRTGPTTVPIPRASTAPPVVDPISAPPVKKATRLRTATRASLALAGVVAALFLIYRVGDAQRRTGAETPAPLAAEKPSAPTTPVRVALRAFPDGAELLLDGRPLGTNPYVAELGPDDKVHELEVRAKGFQSRTLPLRLNRDLDLEVRLSEAEDTSETLAKKPARAQRDAQPASTAPLSPARTPSRTKIGAKLPTNPRSKSETGEPYGDFPKSKPSQEKLPPLDTTNPWTQ